MPSTNHPNQKPEVTQHDLELQRQRYKQRNAPIEEMLSRLGRVVKKEPKKGETIVVPDDIAKEYVDAYHKGLSKLSPEQKAIFEALNIKN
jgi:hypothetical protein